MKKGVVPFFIFFVFCFSDFLFLFLCFSMLFSFCFNAVGTRLFSFCFQLLLFVGFCVV